MSKRMMVDIDDTVGNFSKQAVKVLNDLRKLTEGSPSCFRTYGSSFWDISDFDFKQLMLDGYIFEHIEPFDGVVEWINQRFVEDWDIVFCTARGFHPNAEELTMEWLSKHGFAYDNLWVVDKSEDKQELNSMFDMVIDDNLNSFTQTGVMHPEFVNCYRYHIERNTLSNIREPYFVDGVFKTISNIREPYFVDGVFKTITDIGCYELSIC